MKYNLSVKEPILEAYPHLAQFEEFQGDDKKLRFVLSLLNPDDEESDLDRRIASAAKTAKLNKDGILEDKQVEAMLCRYFIILNNDTFELWLSKKIAFGECNHRLRESVADSKDPIGSMKTKLQVSELAETLRSDILKLERQLFKDEKVAKKIKESVQNMPLHFIERWAETDTVS